MKAKKPPAVNEMTMFSLRVSTEDLALMKEAAAQRRLPLATWLRLLAFEKIDAAARKAEAKKEK